jgi:thiol-disulfide isomerase/thioredoxin
MKRGLVVVAFMLLANTVGAVELDAPMPGIWYTDWIKGEPIVSLDSSKLLVLDCWATWCGPCRDQIPHMTQLQHQYQDEVVFLGISSESPAIVEPFVTAQGEQMDYAIACDESNQTFVNYQIQFIPHCFIIDQRSYVVWEGHPYYLDQALAAEVAAMLLASAPVGPGFAEEGAPYTLSANASGGVGALSYTWFKDGDELAETGPTLQLASVGALDGGNYRYVVEDSEGRQQVSPSMSVMVAPAGSLPAVSLSGMLLLTCGLAWASGLRTRRL